MGLLKERHACPTSGFGIYGRQHIGVLVCRLSPVCLPVFLRKEKIMEQEWQTIIKDENSKLEQTQVEGGWLYRSTVEIGSEEACSVSVALAFVPEPEE